MDNLSRTDMTVWRACVECLDDNAQYCCVEWMFSSATNSYGAFAQTVPGPSP
jgi:hypothetical protein